jgi:hypothetical protein
LIIVWICSGREAPDECQPVGGRSLGPAVFLCSELATDIALGRELRDDPFPVERTECGDRAGPYVLLHSLVRAGTDLSIPMGVRCGGRFVTSRTRGTGRFPTGSWSSALAPESGAAR